MFAHPSDVVGFDIKGAKRAVAALAIVVAGAALGLVLAGRDAVEVTAFDSMTMRAAQMETHLDTLVVTGQAQIGAMRDAELLRQRINTGLVQQDAIDALVAADQVSGHR